MISQSEVAKNGFNMETNLKLYFANRNSSTECNTRKYLKPCNDSYKKRKQKNTLSYFYLLKMSAAKIKVNIGKMGRLFARKLFSCTDGQSAVGELTLRRSGLWEESLSGRRQRKAYGWIPGRPTGNHILLWRPTLYPLRRLISRQSCYFIFYNYLSYVL